MAKSDYEKLAELNAKLGPREVKTVEGLNDKLAPTLAKHNALRDQATGLQPEIKALQDKIAELTEPLKQTQADITAQFDAVIAEAEASNLQTPDGLRALDALKARRPPPVVTVRGAGRLPIAKDQLAATRAAIDELNKRQGKAGEETS